MKRGRFPEWPDHRFETVIVANTEPKPDDAPDVPNSVVSLAKLIEDNGWQVRIGYSRAWRRGMKTGTYRVMDAYGVFAGSHPETTYRIIAIYWRFADKAETYSWFADTGLELTEKSKGEPGTWTWQDARIVRGFARHRVKVTDVKEFVRVCGSVLPGWFKAIEKRFAEQAAKQLCGALETHEPHTWSTVSDVVKSCSGKAAKPKKVEGD